MGGCQAGAAGPRLQGKPVLDHAGSLDNPGGRLGDFQLYGIFGNFGGAGHDAFGVADTGHFDNIINACLRNGDG